MAGPQIDAVEKRLKDRGARSLPFGGGCAIALGAVFLGLGLMFAVAVGVLLVAVPEASREDLRNLRWLGPPTVLFVCVVGAGLLIAGVRGQRRQERGARMAALHPDQPWLADGAWDPNGALAESEWDGRTLLVVLMVLLVAAPFNVLWLYVFDAHAERTRRLFALMVLIPDFFMYLVGRGLVVMLRDHLRYGRARLHFDAFPFFLGGELGGRLTAKIFAGQEGVTATLRCIDERMVATRQSGGSVDSVEPFQLYEARQTFPGRFGGRAVPFALPLPERPSTHLLRQPPCYWELEVKGEGAGDAVRFLVPVYAPPAGPAEAR
jgi:hypothetical protein